MSKPMCQGLPRWLSGKESASAGDAGNKGSILGSGRFLEEEMMTHSSIPAWKIPWTEEPVGLQPTGLQESDTNERLHTPTDVPGAKLVTCFSLFQTRLFHFILPPPILFHANPLYSLPFHSGSTNACLSPTCEPCSLLYLTPSTSLLSFSCLSDSFWWPRAAPVFVFSLISLPPSNSSSPGGALGKLCPTDRALSLASDIPYYPRGLTWTPGCRAPDNQRGWGQWQFFMNRIVVCLKDVSEQRA